MQVHLITKVKLLKNKVLSSWKSLSAIRDIFDPVVFIFKFLHSIFALFELLSSVNIVSEIEILSNLIGFKIFLVTKTVFPEEMLLNQYPVQGS